MDSQKIKRLLLFSRKKQQHFLEDLSALLNDGVTLKDAIITIEAVTQGQTKELAHSIREALSSGAGLADGMHGWFLPTTLEIVRAGESSGTLTQAISAAAHALKDKNILTNSLLASLVYPFVVLFIALSVLVMIKRSVLENFAAITPISQWPSNGVTLYRAAQFIENWWWAMLAIVLMVTLAIYFFLRDFTGETRSTLDRLPLLSLYRDSIAARFMQTLGLLITNGIILKKALQILAQNAKPYLAWHILMMEYRLSGGLDNIADILETDLLRKEDITRLKVIARGKGFAAALITLGQQAKQRNQQTAILGGKILGAIILVLDATIAANIILGIYSIGNTLAH